MESSIALKFRPSQSEVMTIVIRYQMRVYGAFKWFYFKHVMLFWLEVFPNDQLKNVFNFEHSRHLL